MPISAFKKKGEKKHFFFLFFYNFSQIFIFELAGGETTQRLEIIWKRYRKQNESFHKVSQRLIFQTIKLDNKGEKLKERREGMVHKTRKYSKPTYDTRVLNIRQNSQLFYSTSFSSTNINLTKIF